MDNWLYIGLVAVGAVVGWCFKGAIAEADMAAYQKEQAIVVKEVKESHAKKLAEATDTLLQAQDDYRTVRAERDRALERLRNNRGGDHEGSSVQALRARVAQLEKLVSQLAEAGSKCDDGWQRCAAKHDALATAVQ